MKVIFCTNLPSPYRVDFFNEFGKYCDLTVLYERHSSSERDKAWKGAAAVNFKEVYLDLQPVGVDRAKGSALRNFIKSHSSDRLIFTNYVSPATMEAILWCRIHNREYYIEYDGGFNKKDSFVKGLLKQLLLKGARGHLTTADEHIRYLLSIGIPSGKIHKYPFTSISEKEIESKEVISLKNKRRAKETLGISEQKMVLAVGQMIHRKGIDILLKAIAGFDNNVGIYIVGGKPNEEIVFLMRNLSLTNVHFVEFKVKKELANYYRAADVFVLPTREDIWGLVINEAMSFGLPVVSSSRSIAAQELVKDGYNGIMAIPENSDSFHRAIMDVISNEEMAYSMGQNSLQVVKGFTFENMAKAHMKILSLNK